MKEVGAFSISGDLLTIEVALVWQAKMVAELFADMAAFQPVPEDQYKPPRPMFWCDGASEAELAEMEQQILAEDPPDHSPEGQFYDAFFERLQALSVTVILTSHALCEATINGAMALAKAHGRVGDLEPLSKSTFARKWLSGPASFIPKYRLGAPLEKRLWELQRVRNRVAHSNVEVLDDEPECCPDCDECCFDPAAQLRCQMSFVRLPFLLLEALCDQVKDADLRFSLQILLTKGAEVDVIFRQADNYLRPKRGRKRKSKES